MHLFSLTEFGDRFGIDMTVPDFVDYVASASHAATRDIASRFRFKDFDVHATRRDVFRCGRMFGAGASQHRQFVLSRGFIEPVTGFSCRYTENFVHVRNSGISLFTDAQNVAEDGESDYVVIDAEQGVVSLYGIDLTDQWLVVDYTCGLDADSNDEAQDVPGWLADAASAKAAIFLKQNRVFQNEDENTADAIVPLRETLTSLFGGHARIYPSALLPTMAEPGK